MQQPPEYILLTWPKPNYVDPITRGNGNFICNIVLYSLVLCFICLRIFTRTYLRKVFGSDDIFILLAMIPTTAFFILSVLADAHFLWIRHQYDVPSDHVTPGLKMVLSAQVMFASACTLTKLSMLMLVRRILTSASLFWRRITQLAIFIVAAQGTVFVITVIFQCRPPQDYWTISVDPQPNCINQANSLLIAGIINTFTDFLVVLLPIRTVWALRLPMRQTILVILPFGCGFISCCAGVVRTYYTYRVSQEWDQVWASYPVWLASGIELYVGVFAASIPATKPFFCTYLPSIFGTLGTTLRGSSSSLNDSPYYSFRSHDHKPFARSNPRKSLSRKNSEIMSAAEGSPEELIDMEKALKMRKTSTTIESVDRQSKRRESGMGNQDSAGGRGGARGDGVGNGDVSEDVLYIRVTQTVELVSTRCSSPPHAL